MNFEELLKKQKQNDFDSIRSAANSEKENPYGGGSGPDDRFWKPSVDKAGNGSAIIRFLPAPDSEIPWNKFYSHGFKGDSGRWLIENCLTSIKKPCCICEANGRLWSSGLDSDKDIARSRKRRLHYVANILVLKDPENPENNNKVFLYKFGPKIFEKILEKLQPTFEDEKPVDPFNLLRGVNFALKIKQIGGYWNYDSSRFGDEVGALYNGDEDKLKKVFESLYPVLEFTDPKNYLSYEDLESKMNEVLLGSSSGKTNNYRTEESSFSKKSSFEPARPSAASSSDESDSEEEDDDMAYFRKLAQSM